MAIKGFQGTSLLDFPGKIASLVFFSGCNLTCPFCHNPSLLAEDADLPDLPLELVVDELAERQDFIDGVVLTGGEPTLAPELDVLVRQIHDMGLQVKLDTNGLAPRVVERMLRENLVDYVALDLKTAPRRYGELHRGPVSMAALQRTVGLLLAADVDCEFRTTCVPGFVDVGDIRQIGELIRGAGLWVLQQFSPQVTLDPGLADLEPYSEEKLRELASLAAGYVERVELRGLR
ncbi:pyruvate formate lyase activating enzyme [Geothermobacter ehrlichii]|uniref:Pyruvate formate lyase activating enzyme n=1 Tax=Geothermobacter ehrlichii TaxID=213224 RepID=A0A5D3WHV3_9BACT|nr:anaerobic ribonucleoside-triphosphate reductase activating protein [Geothermobacter ehrlichii]TYO97144.1 pyruvate formate lyase activating enzyme [Geothermobacter ehrlichii]